MQKVGVLFLGFIAIVALGVLLVELRDTVTGKYVTSGGGEWYYGPQPAQLAPDEACIYSGYQPMKPLHVRTNEFGTVVSQCWNGPSIVEVPLVQIVYVQ